MRQLLIFLALLLPLDDFDFAYDLTQSLVDVGYNTQPLETKSLAFDLGAIAYNTAGLEANRGQAFALTLGTDP